MKESDRERNKHQRLEDRQISKTAKISPNGGTGRDGGVSAARTHNSSPDCETEKDAVEQAVNGSVYPIMYPPPPHGYYPQTNQHQAFGPDGQPIPRYLTTCYPFVQESYIYMPHYRQVSQETKKTNSSLPW